MSAPETETARIDKLEQIAGFAYQTLEFARTLAQHGICEYAFVNGEANHPCVGRVEAVHLYSDPLSPVDSWYPLCQRCQESYSINGSSILVDRNR